MKKRVADSTWIPFWIDKWIFGSMRIEFTLEERAIWVDLLALAAKDDGFIRANEITPYPIQQLSGMLIIPENILKSAIEKFVKKGKIIRDKNGVLYIATWEKYRFTDRYKRMLRHDISEKSEDTSEKKETRREEKRREEKRKEEKKKKSVEMKKQNSKFRITFNEEKEKFEGITEKDIVRWKETYLACDIDHELKKMIDWLINNPKQRKKNYGRFISNWLSRAQDRGGSRIPSEKTRRSEWVKKYDKKEGEG